MRPIAGSSLATLIVSALSWTVIACQPESEQTSAPWPTSEWATSTPTTQGISGTPFTVLDQEIRAGAYGYVDRMLVVRNGYAVVDERYENDYREIGRNRREVIGCGVDACRDSSEVHEFNYLHPDYHPFYRGREVHTLQSVTKSIAATVIGIAVGRGDLSSLDTPLLSFFEQYDVNDVDPRLRNATLDDLLTMRSGIEWHESDRPLDETNTTWQLENAADWIQFTLSQPMDAAPGEKWVYNSGGSHLMSGVIRSATGEFIDTYAEQYLFGPLGIDEYHWKKTPQGYPDTEGGLYLRAEDLAKIGLLYLRGGEWDGQRILPDGWTDQATARRVEDVNPAGWGYGLQWWRLDRGDTVIWAGLGFGGQFLLVLPQHDVVGVINSWNIFGDAPANVRSAFIEALLASVGG